MKVIKEKGILSFHDDLGNIAEVSLITGDMREYKSSKNKWFPRKSLTWFFKDFDTYGFNDWYFEDDKLKLFFTYLADNYHKCHNIGTFIKRMKENETIEVLLKMGFHVTRYTSVYSDTLEHINSIPKDIRKWFIDNKKFDALAFSNLSHKFYQGMMRNLLLIDDLEFIWSFVDYWFGSYYSSDMLENIKLNNLDIKRFVSYVYYLYKSENLSHKEINNNLFDYLRMAKLVYQNGRFEKYPKYLKSKHDIVNVHYELFKEEYPEELFQLAYKGYNYEYSNSTDKYIILKPKSTVEIKEEGRDLSHCVKSYISTIINGKTLIYFMRDIKEQDKSLLTVEIFNNKIKQVHGEFNRNPTQKEMDFLNKFAKTKGLEMNKYIEVDNDK